MWKVLSYVRYHTFQIFGFPLRFHPQSLGNLSLIRRSAKSTGGESSIAARGLSLALIQHIRQSGSTCDKNGTLGNLSRFCDIPWRCPEIFTCGFSMLTQVYSLWRSNLESRWTIPLGLNVHYYIPKGAWSHSDVIELSSMTAWRRFAWGIDCLENVHVTLS